MNNSDSLTKNLSSLSNLIKANKSGTMNNTEVNFMLSPNSKKSPKETFPAISIQDLKNTLLNEKNKEDLIIPEVNEEESKEPELIIFQKYENFSEELEKIYKEKFEILEDRNRNLSHKNMEIVERITELNQYITDLKDENYGLAEVGKKAGNNEVKKNDEISMLKFKLAELENIVKKNSEEKNTKEELIEGLKKENEDLRMISKRLETDKEKLQSEILEKNYLKGELEYASNSLTESENIRNELQKAIEGVRKEKEKCMEFLEKIKIENKTLSSKITEVSEEMEMTLVENKKLKSELDEEKGNASRVKTLELKVDEYEGKVDELSRSLNQKEFELKQKETQLLNLENQVGDANKKIETLKGINDAYTQNFKLSQYEKMMLEKESVENIGSARAKLEELLYQRDEFKKIEHELRSQIEEKDIELNGYKLMEEELKFQLDHIHDQYIESEAKRNHIEQIFNELTKEIDNYASELEEKKIQNEKIFLQNQSQDKIIQSYKVLFSEIAKKIQEINFSNLSYERFNVKRIQIYDLIPERYEDENEREAFLSNLGNFESVVKDILDCFPEIVRQRENFEIELQEKEMEYVHLENKMDKLKVRMREFINEEKNQFEPEEKNYQGVAKDGKLEKYRRALDNFKTVFKQCFKIFENLLQDPSKIQSLVQIVSKHVDMQLLMEVEEEELIQKELLAKTNKDLMGKKDTYRDITKAKETIRGLQEKIEFYDRKQSVLMKELRAQISNYSYGGDTIKVTTKREREERYKEPLNFNGLFEEKIKSSRGQRRSKGQTFFKVSKVDEQIAKMLDEGSERVRETIQKIRKSRYKHYGD